MSAPETREEWADFSREFLRASGYPEGLLTGALDGVSIADGHTPELWLGPDGIELHAVPDGVEGAGWRESRMLACGRCYEENGEETHSHPLCCHRKDTA